MACKNTIIARASKIMADAQETGVLDPKFKRNIYATYEPGKLKILVCSFLPQSFSL